jgi:hypothetical protein
MKEQQIIEIVVAITMDADADIAEVISEMDYVIAHPQITDTEIRDILTEN